MLLNYHLLIKLNVQIIIHERYLKNMKQRSKRRDNEVKMTRLLVIIMVSFTILTTPNTCVNFLFYFYFDYSSASHIVNAMANTMMTLNYSLNFYLLTGLQQLLNICIQTSYICRYILAYIWIFSNYKNFLVSVIVFLAVKKYLYLLENVENMKT